MTKFTTLDGTKKEGKKTVFTRAVSSDCINKNPINAPEDFDNVLHIGHDIAYGDVFKAWTDNNQTAFTIYFGIKGDEFD